MSTKLFIALLVTSVCGAQNAAEGRPVYKLLYSPPVGPTGNPNAVVEVEPGVFHVLNTRSTNLSGSSIMRLTSSGSNATIYSFPPNTYVGTLLQGTNGKLYGATFINKLSHYFSLDPSGRNFQRYAIPLGWQSDMEMAVDPRDGFRDIVGRIQGSSIVYGFARITADGKVTILHEFAASEGIPFGTNIVYAANGDTYGIGWNGQSPPAGFIFGFSPAGVYSKLLTFPTLSDGPPLVAGSDGNLYGEFTKAGTNHTGEIYQATLSGQFQAGAIESRIIQLQHDQKERPAWPRKEDANRRV